MSHCGPSPESSVRDGKAFDAAACNTSRIMSQPLRSETSCGACLHNLFASLCLQRAPGPRHSLSGGCPGALLGMLWFRLSQARGFGTLDYLVGNGEHRESTGRVSDGERHVIWGLQRINGRVLDDLS